MKNQLMTDFSPETMSFPTCGKLTRELKTHVLAQS